MTKHSFLGGTTQIKNLNSKNMINIVDTFPILSTVL